jgi:hypothetical protein
MSYEENRTKGELYQDFISDVLYDKYFIQINCFKSKKYQLRGENKQGIEIKFDDLYKKTDNLYIEIAEKSNANNLNFIESGIYRKDNTWLYIIGDYDTVFIFGKTMLKLLHNWHDANGNKKYEEKEIDTSRGFLLPKSVAEIYALLIIKT